jgi:MFS family permease
MSRRGFAALVVANAASNLGNVVAVVALPWFVLETTGSAARAGLVAFATTVPLAVGAVLGGSFVDRIGVRRASVLADLGAGVAIASIPTLHLLDALSFPALLGCAFAAGACESPGRAARRAMLPDLAARAGMPLERANSIATTSEHLGYVAGAPVAGVLIATAGAPGALWVDAASFGLSAGVVGLAVPSLRPALERAPLLEGARFVLATPLLRTFFGIWTVGAFLIGPLAAVVLPVYAREELGGAAELAACVTAYGAGGLAGTLAFGVAGARFPRRAVYVGTWLVYPTLSLLLLPLPPLVPALVVLAAIGFVVGAYDPFEATIHQELIPPELRARAFALLTAAEMTALPVSLLANGILIDAVGLGAAVALFALGNVVLAAYALANAAARDLYATSSAQSP